MRVWQEFHCPRSGGGCGGFVLLKLNMALNRVVTIVCPKCKHEHCRNIIDGQLVERGRWKGSSTETIIPTLAAWSDTSRLKTPYNQSQERDARLVTPEELEWTPEQHFLRQSWAERYAGRSLE